MRPFSIARTIEQKLSSVKIMSEAPLATSVPSKPIATPMSALFNAGASFTPSPVMAHTQPWRCRDLTISSLSSGLALAKTLVDLVRLSISACPRYGPSLIGRRAPQSVASPLPSRKDLRFRMLMFLAMAMAVFR